MIYGPDYLVAVLWAVAIVASGLACAAGIVLWLYTLSRIK